ILVPLCLFSVYTPPPLVLVAGIDTTIYVQDCCLLYYTIGSLMVQYLLFRSSLSIWLLCKMKISMCIA
ncbi:hypothetical protein EDC94DRAFT_612492, partial [Helicostylum pulchrum]